VVGNSASEIYGALNANGQVFLVNPNGILFAPGASVNVGGLAASSLNISNENFLVGNNVFQKDANATVTTTHSRTADLGSHTREADVLVVAVGQVDVVTADMVKPGSTVVDVGMNRTDDGLRGDVDPAAVEVAGLLTPVPGGVGPMTIASLLRNTVEAARLRRC
jgi:5,10-methylene-tetrahydrofolate dehydrogenase/methenyl tetrahydrofolate cyclohydrolase